LTFGDFDDSSITFDQFAGGNDANSDEGPATSGNEITTGDVDSSSITGD